VKSKFQIEYLKAKTMRRGVMTMFVTMFAVIHTEVHGADADNYSLDARVPTAEGSGNSNTKTNLFDNTHQRKNTAEEKSELFDDQPIEASANRSLPTDKAQGQIKADAKSSANSFTNTAKTVPSPPSVPRSQSPLPVAEKVIGTNLNSNSGTMSEGQPLLEGSADVFQSDAAPMSVESVAPVRNVLPMDSNKFSGAPILPGSRKVLPRGMAPEFYKVEAGDTMYDICDQLIDDGNYWPKFWSFNPDVKNPHFIFPGMSLAFYPGDEETPPSIDVIAEDDMVPVEKGPLNEAELVVPVSEIPEPAPEFDYAANVSIPTQSGVVEGSDAPIDMSAIADIFIDGGKQFRPGTVGITVPAFVVAEELPELAVVQGGTRHEVLVGDGGNIKIEADEALNVGLVYTAMRPRGKVYHPATGDFVGYRYDFSAHVRISSKVSDDEYTGTVQNSEMGVRPDDVLVSFKSTHREINESQNGQSTTADATIIGLGFFNQKFAGRGQIVFLDSRQLPTGGIYTIFQTDDNATVFSTDSDLESIGKPVGTLKVIESTAGGSLGYILKSKSEIRLGDRLTPKLSAN
jgi:hypothetical protein